MYDWSGMLITCNGVKGNDLKVPSAVGGWFLLEAECCTLRNWRRISSASIWLSLSRSSLPAKEATMISWYFLDQLVVECCLSQSELKLFQFLSEKATMVSWCYLNQLKVKCCLS